MSSLFSRPYGCFFISTHSKFDVGRWTFDVLFISLGKTAL